jgi:osmotically-inducible protein OsmY
MKIPDQLQTQSLFVPSVLVIVPLTVGACASHPGCRRDGCVADRQITQSIDRLLLQYPSLQAPNTVRVQTVNQAVYLYGQVNNEGERSTAQEAAQSVAGVTRVVNSISLQYEGR